MAERKSIKNGAKVRNWKASSNFFLTKWWGVCCHAWTQVKARVLPWNLICKLICLRGKWHTNQGFSLTGGIPYHHRISSWLMALMKKQKLDPPCDVPTTERVYSTYGSHYKRIWIDIHTYTVYIYIHTFTHTYLHIHTCTYIYIDTYIWIHLHTHT